MDFDSVLLEIGEFGRYQQTNYLLLCIPVLFAAANSLTYVFTAGVPNYRCFVPGCDTHESTYDQPWVSTAVPGETDPTGLFRPALCERFNRISNITNDLSCEAHSFDRQQTVRCNTWVFDSHEHTIVQDWMITCKENQWMLSLVGTMHFAGIVVGSGVAGFIADRYGRKSVFVVSILFMSFTGIGQALSSNYHAFALFAFLNAVGTAGVFPLAFIMAVEMVGRKKREMFGIVLNYFYSIGEALVGVLAWQFGDWITLQYLVSAPPLLFVFYFWIIPESVRWLMAQKKIREAGIIVLKAAKTNGKQLSEGMLQTFELKSTIGDISKSKVDMSRNRLHGEEFQTWQTLKQFLSSRKLVLRCFILFFIWATNAFVFYGLSVNSTSFSGNKYLNFILICLVEIPGYTFSWITMNKIGRRWSLAGSLLLCAFSCIAGGFVPQDWTWFITILFLLGKLGVTSAFSTAYVHTAEMLPTVIRSGGVGTASTVARFGALVAPFVPLLNYIYRPLPLLLFGSVSLIAGLLALMLPETLGYKLPDTAEEAELLGEKRWSDASDNSLDGP